MKDRLTKKTHDKPAKYCSDSPQPLNCCPHPFYCTYLRCGRCLFQLTAKSLFWLGSRGICLVPAAPSQVRAQRRSLSHPCARTPFPSATFTARPHIHTFLDNTTTTPPPPPDLLPPSPACLSQINTSELLSVPHFDRAIVFGLTGKPSSSPAALLTHPSTFLHAGTSCRNPSLLFDLKPSILLCPIASLTFLCLAQESCTRRLSLCSCSPTIIHDG